MAHRYGQYCPLALAVELLCERWTLLVVSRLIDGCKQFNEIHRGVPRISPSLLSRRLSELERAGLVKRGPARKGLPRSCTLTPATASCRWEQRPTRESNPCAHQADSRSAPAARRRIANSRSSRESPR
jgi:DNA-binding HxlR family transcriptional regulator